MTSQNWVSLLSPATPHGSGAGAALSTAATATLSPVTGGSADVAQVNAEGFYQGWENGVQIRVTARGFITTTATSTTFTGLLAARVGNAGATYITLATTPGLTTGTGALTGIQWRFEALIRCTNVATAGNTVATQGEFTFQSNVTAPAIGTANATFLPAPSVSGETNAAVDTTQQQGLSLRGTLAGANATVQLTQWAVEMLC
jgi:hypothetical protein